MKLTTIRMKMELQLGDNMYQLFKAAINRIQFV